MRKLANLLNGLMRDTGGNTLVIAAAALIPLTLIVGSGLDLSVAYMARGKLQNACDAGVLAARQAMDGNRFTTAIEAEAERFFEFNFPDGTAGAFDIDFEVEQDAADRAQLLGEASATVPTSLMRIAGFTSIPISVSCDAKRDLGHNDVLLVLDVTGSMAERPSRGGGTKIGRLRQGAAGIYRGLSDDNGSVIRFGIVPYSQTVNVGGSLSNHHILVEQEYIKRNQVCNWWCTWVYSTKSVHIRNSTWGRNNRSLKQNIEAFRTSNDACIEERPSVGNSMSPFRINNRITRADVDTMAPLASLNEAAGTFVPSPLQFGRYDPGVQEAGSAACPSAATRLQTYASEAAFQTAINNATARVTGNTYHDVGMLWGVRFISRTGVFAADNPADRDGIPVSQHIVFMTDGILQTSSSVYSAHGVEQHQNRTQGSGGLDNRHISRFNSVCNLARSMNITVWVIALDVRDTDDVEACAASPDHFYTSDGSDLEDIFEEIGRGIGNLRLTR